MYREYFGLQEPPFSISPDPRYLYMSERHREALAHLLYGLESGGGFVLLTGEVGTGKTTVCRCLLEQVPEETDVAFILNPKLTAEELLATICDELGIDYPDGGGSIKVFVDRINAYLLYAHGRGRSTVLIIDEAQNLGAAVLEQIRLLTNLETERKKLLQVIMLGQPELQEMLARPELRQLAQRITARYHLTPIPKSEVASYVRHRLSVAGLRRELFPPSIIRRIFRHSGGTPRLINILCDRALLGTCLRGKSEVGRKILDQAVVEVLGEKKGGGSRLYLSGLALLALAAALIAGTYRLEAPEPKAPEPKAAIVESAPGPVLSLDDFVSSVEKKAYRSLFESWGLRFEGGDPCSQAKEHGLACLEGRGSLGSLRGLNLPAVLTLFDRGGNPFFATLLGLEVDSVRLRVGDETRVVPVPELETYWLGEYSLLWRPPSRYPGVLRAGEEGEAVEWLESRLAGIRGRAPREGAGLTFDDRMVTEVKKFQMAEGLDPDGIVGAQTMIRLKRGMEEDAPALNAEYEER